MYKCVEGKRVVCSCDTYNQLRKFGFFHFKKKDYECYIAFVIYVKVLKMNVWSLVRGFLFFNKESRHAGAFLK